MDEKEFQIGDKVICDDVTLTIFDRIYDYSSGRYFYSVGENHMVYSGSQFELVKAAHPITEEDFDDINETVVRAIQGLQDIKIALNETRINLNQLKCKLFDEEVEDEKYETDS